MTLGATVGQIALDLYEYDEDETATWVLTCSDDELMRICSVADWLTLHGPKAPSGASMMIAKACALAAVFVCEGRPRELRRSRRRPRPDAPSPASSGRRPDFWAQSAAPRDYGVDAAARAFWADGS